MKLRLGTRGSALAVGQSSLVADLLRALGHEVELVRIKTGGDVEKGSLTRLGTLGVFAAELRTALLDGRVDFAVHSLKDLPVAPVPGLRIAAVPGREDPRDALCARDGLTLAGLPAGASVGTGSPRRVAQLRALRPDLTFVDIRGNVGTRLARVASGDLDAVVLAAAGLRRLGLAEHITDLLEILPAPGQGALAVECRCDNAELVAALGQLDDPQAHASVEAERAVLAGLGGGCAAPIAALASDGHVTGAVFALDGSRSVQATHRLAPGAGRRVVDDLRAAGAGALTNLTAARESRLEELHDDTSLWGSARVLAGVRVLLPRPDGRLADAIRAAGAEVVSHPVQRHRTLPAQVDLAGADWVVFTSAVTVQVLDELGVALPAGIRVAAVGAATAEALAAHGIATHLIPEGKATAAALAEAFPAGEGTVVIPGSKLSAATLPDGLAAKGWHVVPVPVYTMETLPELPAALVEEWQQGHFDAVVITAGSVGASVAQLLGWRDGTAVVAFGEPTAEALTDLGARVAATAHTQDAAGVIFAISSLGES